MGNVLYQCGAQEFVPVEMAGQDVLAHDTLLTFMNKNCVDKLWTHYSRIDAKGIGSIQFADFLDAYKLEKSVFLLKLFNSLCFKGTSRMTFLEFASTVRIHPLYIAVCPFHPSTTAVV